MAENFTDKNNAIYTMFWVSLRCVIDCPKLGDLSSDRFPVYCDLYIRNEGRAQLGDSPAVGDINWDGSMVPSQWWGCSGGSNKLYHTPGSLAGMAVELDSVGPSFYV